jgi:hypothetical protein
MRRKSPSQSRNYVIISCCALPKLWQIPTPCSTCLVDDRLMTNFLAGSSSFRNRTSSFQLPKARRHLFSSNSSRRFPRMLKIHPSIWIFSTNTSFTSPRMTLGMATFSSTFGHRSLGLIILEMIIDAFAIRPLDTSLSVTFYTDVGLIPYSPMSDHR